MQHGPDSGLMYPLRSYPVHTHCFRQLVSPLAVALVRAIRDQGNSRAHTTERSVLQGCIDGGAVSRYNVAC